MTRVQGWITAFSAALLALVVAGPPLYGAISSTIQHIEDTAHTSGDVGTMGLSVRKDTAGTLCSTDGDYCPEQLTAAGSKRIEISEIATGVGVAVDTEDADIAAGNASAALTVRLAYLYNGSSWVRANPLPHKKISAASNNATNVKAARGLVIGLSVTNNNASVRYLKLYDKASAPTCGSDTPVYTIPVPGNTATAGHTPHLFAIPVPFANGIGYCMVTGIGDADNTSVAANELVLNLTYQ
jgi:hypothetical protein